MKKITFSLFLMMQLLSSAQYFNYHNFTVDDGLPSSETYDILQDNNKFIWIATDRGVSKFDGYTFRHFGKEDGLCSVPVFKLYKDPFERIWFISVNGKLSYYACNKIVPYRYNDKLKRLDSAYAMSYICSFNVLSDSTVILGTVNRGAFKVDGKGNAKRIGWNDPYGNDYSVLHKQDQLMFCYNTENIPNYIVSKFKGNRLNIYENGELKYSTLTNEGHEKKIYCLERKNGHVLYASHGVLLDYFKGEIHEKKIPGNEVISMYEDKDSCLWLGYYRGGVLRFLPNRSFYDGHYQTYFPQKQISKVLEDYEGGFWFATLHEGLLYVPSARVECLSLSPNAYAEEKTVVMESDGQSRLFVGTNKSMVYVFSGGQLADSVRIIEKTRMGVIKSIFYDTIHRDLYVSTYGSASRIDAKGKKNRINKPSLCFSADRNGTIYAGYYHSVFRNYPYNLSGDVNMKGVYLRAQSICFDRKDVLWIGSPLGLFYYLNGKVSAVEGDMAKENVQCVTELNNRMFAGTFDGKLLEIDPVKKTVISHPLDAGTIYHLEPINDSLIGISSSRGGLFYNIMTKKEVYRLSASNGLLSTEVRQMELLNDTVYILTYKGVSFIRADNISKNITPPYIHLISCIVDSVDYTAARNPEFSYGKNYIAFNFVGLAYRSLGKVKYRYRLKGYNERWNEITTNLVEFPFLPEGNYVFEVIAVNEDGVESKSPATFGFTVLMPFWKTTWFIFSCLLIIAGIVALVFYVRYRRLKEKNHMLLQITELRQKAMSLQMNPHFIFNSLNSIQSFVLSEDSYKATRYLSRFAKLMRMGLNHANTDKISLEDEIMLLSLYLELEQMRFKRRFEYAINVDHSIDRKGIFLPPMLIQPLVENCIKHGINHGLNQNRISVKFYWDKEMLMCSVEDNGKGYKESQRSKQQSGVNVHHSMGMHITTQRIQLFCDRERHPFVFEVLDKKDLGLQETGTIINFTVPYNK